MNIDRLLKAYPHAPDEAMLEMILSNRIDRGSSAGGMISVAQFALLAKDLIAWRTWSSHRTSASETSLVGIDTDDPSRQE